MMHSRYGYVAALWVALLLFMPLTSWAQTRTITGTVRTSEDDAPLPGASVILVGTSTGAATDAEGEYELEVPEEGGTLRFTFVGYVPQEVEIGDQSEINVALDPDFKELGEVVVVGYGSQIQRDVTGNISRVSAEDIENVPVTSIEETLQGRAAGVQVRQNNGKLGQGISVQVRGIASLSADTEPLYVVDGIPVTTSDLSSNGAATNPLADLNFNDVESIEILKDAAASAIYGARASNGVVLITTKSGTQGDTRVTVNYQLSSSEPTNTVDFLNANEYVELFMEAGVNAGFVGSSIGFMNFFGGLPDEEGNLLIDYAQFLTDAGEVDYNAIRSFDFPVNADWQDEAFQNALGMQFDLSVNGGNENTRFYISGQYRDEEGILIGNALQRISGRVNIDHDATDWLQVGGKLSLTQTINDRVSNDNAFSTPIQLVAQMPISPIYSPVSSALDQGQFRASDDLNRETLYFNGLLYLDNVRYDTRVFRSLANAFANFQILPELTFRTEFGVDLLDQNEDQYFNSQVAENTGAAAGLGFNAYDRVINYNTNNYLTYTQAFAQDHDIEVTAGFSFQGADFDAVSVEAQSFPNDNFGQIDSGALLTDGEGNETGYRFLSYFARSNYKFKDRYLLTLSGRVDGSSRFGEDNRYGFFPAVSAGWILSDEAFLQDTDAISFLKLRGSVGVTGNAGIDNFAALGLFGATNYTSVAGIRPTQLPNPDLKWERTLQYDVGLEFGFLNNRINGGIDFYVKDTRDLLLSQNVPSTTGFDFVTRNVGEVRNRGFELTLNTSNIIQDNFSWSTNVNFGLNRNEVTDLDGQIIEGGALNRAIEGEPLGVFFAYEYAGVDPENGDALYFVNGSEGDRSTTNNPNEANRVVIGSPLPDFTGGVSNEFSYRGFDARVFFQFVYGNKIYDGGGVFRSANGDFFDNQTADQLDRWQEPGDITDVPEARLFSGNGTAESSRYLEDGSYLRLKNLTLGYTLPETLASRLSIERARIYLTGINLLTFTEYDLWDPEVNADYLADDSNLSLGYEFYTAPQARRYTAGVQFTF